jgi:ribonuclease P protein component
MAFTISRLPKDQFQAQGFRVIRTPYFSLKTKKNQLAKQRIGVVAGKAVHKTAVKRNFWRRQAKAQLSVFIKPGTDLLMIFSPKVNQLTKERFKESLKEAIGKL